MTTAREQAREAVASTYNAAPIGTNVGLTSLADAASDVWEPLLLDLLLEAMWLKAILNDDHVNANADSVLDASKRAREALEFCLSRGPRIGNEGCPYCKLPKGHDVASVKHCPAEDDGWGPTVYWGDY
jgi:hypothetical protein